jgi:hypothetical protein
MDMHGLDLTGINGISQVLTVHLCQHQCTPEATYCLFDPLAKYYMYIFGQLHCKNECGRIISE